MTAAQSSCTEEIVRLERLAYVLLWRSSELPEEILDCLISPMMHPTDPQLAPMYDAIAARCCTMNHQETLKIKGMIFGEAQHTEYIMHPSCPGSTVDHLCVSLRHEDPERGSERWLSTDQYRR